MIICSEDQVLSLNKQAMAEASKKNFSEALGQINQALIYTDLLKSSPFQHKLFSITYNNLGCLYKKAGDLGMALKYLYKAIEYQKYIPTDIGNIAGTHLNICTILSEMSEHEKAMRHGLKALSLLKSAQEPKLVNTLIVAHYNVAVEYEFLEEFEEALSCYMEGIRVAQHSHIKSGIVGIMRKSYQLLLNQRPNTKFLKLPQRNRRNWSEDFRSRNINKLKSISNVKQKRTCVSTIRKVKSSERFNESKKVKKVNSSENISTKAARVKQAIEDIDYINTIKKNNFKNGFRHKKELLYPKNE